MATALQCHKCNSVKTSNELVSLSCSTHSVCKGCLNSTECKQREDIFSSEFYDPPSKESIYVYMDNSNVWIEAKKLKGQLKGKEDRQIRVDVGKLLKIIAKDRIVAKAVLYGSEPPAADTVWKSIKEKGWEVKVRKRNPTTNKEKGVDSELVVDVCRTIFKNSPENKTIVFISGDGDFMPPIEEAKKDKWKVEVYMWKHAISNEFKNEPGISIHFLDNFKDKILFHNMKLPIADKPQLLAQARQTGVVCKMEENAFGTKRQDPTKKWREEIQEKFGNFQYFWMKEVNKTNKEVKNMLVLVFEIEKTGSNKIADIVHSKTKIPKVLEKKTYFEYKKEAKEQSNIDVVFPKFSSSEETDEQNELDIQTVQDDQTNEVSPIEEKCPTLNEDDQENDTSPSSENEEGWTIVNRSKKKRKRKKQLYSQQCEKRFYCQFGNHCKYKHTPKEKEYFDAHNGKGMKPLKSQLCKKEACPYVRNPEKCNYAHGESDGFCLKCFKRGHFLTSCNTDS